MNLEHELAAYRADFARTAPCGRPGLFEAKIEDLRANGKALSAINGDENWELPVPATYVIAKDGRVTLAYLDVDYRKRLEPEIVLAALRLAGA
ncbi:hypothetical protein [Roseovarius sp.]|uniref:hypothetical protein n=1 Tax=Roseovarius sp. TaxID=1486281 RepID=UPI003A97B304